VREAAPAAERARAAIGLAADAAGVAIGAVLAAIAVARRAKPVHPHGVTYGARLSVPGAAGAPAGFVVGALPDASSPRPAGADEFHRLARAASSGRLTFGLAIATLPGNFERVATIHIGEPLPDVLEGLRFNPFQSGGGLHPTGMLNRMRRVAYPLSQRALAATGPCAAAAAGRRGAAGTRALTTGLR